jgi:hypothetical protein
MTMEHETGPMPPNALAKETVEAVRRALRGHGGPTPASEPAPELRSALQELARDARAKAVPPEELLATLKAIWQGLLEVENAPDQTERTRVLQRIVTICMKKYFAE